MKKLLYVCEKKFDTNKITFIRGNDFKIKSYPLKSKLECAKIIFDQILSL